MAQKPSRRAAHISAGSAAYIVSRNTRLLDRPDSNAQVLAVLQPRAQVIWLGPYESDRRWQKVRYGVHTGVILRVNLASTKPCMETLAVTETCAICGGSGRVDADTADCSILLPAERPYPFLGCWRVGAKHPAQLQCPACRGSGRNPDVSDTSAFMSSGGGKA